MDVKQLYDRLVSAKRVEVLYDYAKKKSAVYSVVSVSRSRVRLANMSDVSAYSLEYLADRLVRVVE